MSTFLKSRVIAKTRTTHYCCECDGRIDKGENCEENCFVDMGRVWSVYICDVCIAFENKLNKDKSKEYEELQEARHYGDEYVLKHVPGYNEFAAEYAILRM